VDVHRWRAATAVLWRTEPAAALVVYFLLAVAEVSYIHLAGPHLSHHGPGLDSAAMLAKYGSVGGLAAYAFFAWRMWLGGSISWGLSLLWKLGAACVIGCYQAPSPFMFGLLALSLAGLVLLFTPAVLGRIDSSARRLPSWRAVGRRPAASS
jgi:hypothetical protein